MPIWLCLHCGGDDCNKSCRARPSSCCGGNAVQGCGFASVFPGDDHRTVFPACLSLNERVYRYGSAAIGYGRIPSCRTATSEISVTLESMGLLRALCLPGHDPGSPAPSLGVVWYLVPDEDQNRDGQSTEYLRPIPGNVVLYRQCDPALYDTLGKLVSESTRERKGRSRVAYPAAGHRVLRGPALLRGHPRPRTIGPGHASGAPEIMASGRAGGGGGMRACVHRSGQRTGGS